jgi:hypothetical protein
MRPGTAVQAERCRAPICPGAQPRAQRRAHLLAAAMLFAYVYAPPGTDLEDLVRFGVFPTPALTGTAMWQVAPILGAQRSLRTHRQSH